MKLNFTIRIPQKDMQRLVNLTLETQTPEFSYEITGEEKAANLTEIAEIRKIIGIDDGSEFPNKLKSMYEDQLHKLKAISANMNNEIEITKAWFEQIKNGLFQTARSDNEKFKALYQVLEAELQNLKREKQLELKNAPDEKNQSPENKKLSQKILLLESEIRAKDARIATLVFAEDQLSKLEFEKQNYQSELVLLKTRLNEPARSMTLQRTRTVQQTTVTEAITKNLSADPASHNQHLKIQNLLMSELNDALVGLKNSKSRNQELEYELSQLRQNDEFLKIKAEEVAKFKLLLDEQNSQIVTLNKKMEENLKINERLNKKLVELKTNNDQLVSASQTGSEKNRKLTAHIEYLERLCHDAKLKNEALIRRLNDLEDEAANTIETLNEKVVTGSSSNDGARDQRKGYLLSAQLLKKDAEMQAHLAELDGANRTNALLRLELSEASELSRQRELAMQNLRADIAIANDKIDALVLKNDDFIRKTAELQNALAEKERTVKAADQRVLELLAEADLLKEELFNFQKTAKEIIFEREAFENEKKKLQDAIFALNLTVSTNKDEIDALLLKNKELDKEINHLKNRLRAAENPNSLPLTESQDPSAQNGKLKGANESLSEENAQLKKEIELLNGKVTKANRQSDEFSKSNNELLEKCQTLATDFANCQKDKAALEDKFEKLTASHEALSRERNDLSALIQTLKAEIQRLNFELGQANLLAKNSALKIIELMALNSDLERRLGELINQNAQLTLENQKLSDALHSETSDHALTKTELAALLQKFNEQEKQFAEFRATQTQLVAELNSDLTNVRKNEKDFAAKNSECAKTIAELEAEVRNMQNLHPETVKGLQNQIYQLKRENGSLKSENEALKRQVAALKAGLDDSDEEDNAIEEDNTAEMPSDNPDNSAEELQAENAALQEKLHRQNLENLTLQNNHTSLTLKMQLLEKELEAKQKSNPLSGAQEDRSSLMKISDHLKTASEAANQNLKLQLDNRNQEQKIALLEKSLAEKQEVVDSLNAKLRNAYEVEMQALLDAQYKNKNEFDAMAAENKGLTRKVEILESQLAGCLEKIKFLNSAIQDFSRKIDLLMREKIDWEAAQPTNSGMRNLGADGQGNEPIDSASSNFGGPLGKNRVRAEAPLGFGNVDGSDSSQAAPHISPSEFAALKSENSLLNRKLNDLQNELQQRLPEYEQKLKGLQENKRAELEEKNRQISELKSSFYKIKTEFDDLKSAHDHLSQENDLRAQLPPASETVPRDAHAKVANELVSALHDNGALAQKMILLQGEVDGLQKKLDLADKIHSELTADAKEKVEALNKLERDVAKGAAENQELKQAIAKCEDLIRQLSEKGVSGSGGISENPLFKNLKDKLEKAEHHLTDAKFENDKLNRILEVLRADFDEKDKQSKALGVLVDSLNQKLKEQAAERAGLALSASKLEAENDDLKNKLANFKEQIRDLTASAANAKKEVQQNEEDINALKSEKDLLDKKLESSSQAQEKLAESNKALSGQLANSSEEVQILEKENTELRNEKSNLSSEINGLKKDNDNLKAKMDNLDQALAALKSELPAKDKLIADLTQKLKEQQDQLQSLSHNAKEDADKIANLETKCARLKTEIEAQENQIGELETNAKRAEREKISAHNEFSTATESLKSLQDKVNSISQENETLKVKIFSSGQRGTGVSSGGLLMGPNDPQALDGVMNQLQIENESLQKELADCQSKLNQNLLESKKLEQDLDAQKHEAETGKREIEDLQKSLDAAIQKNKNLMTENGAFELKNNELKDQLELNDQKYSQLAAINKSLEERLSQKTQEATDLNAEILDLKKRLMELQAKLDSLEQEIARKNNQPAPNINSDEDFNQLRLEVAQLGQANNLLSQKLENSLNELAQKDKQLKDLNDSFQQALNEAKELLQKNSELNQSLNTLKIEGEISREQTAKTTEEIDNKNKELQNLKDLLNKLELSKAAKDSEIAGLMADQLKRNSELETLKLKSQEDFANFSKGNKNANPVDQELLAKLTSLSDELLKLKSLNEKQTKELTEAKNELQVKIEEIAQKNKKLENIDKELRENITLAVDLKNELGKEKSRADLLEIKLKNLEQENLDLKSKTSGQSPQAVFINQLEIEMGQFENLSNESSQRKLEIESLLRKINELEKNLEERKEIANSAQLAKETAQKEAKDALSAATNASNELERLKAGLELKDMKIKSLEDEAELRNKALNSASSTSASFANFDFAAQLGPISAVKSELNDAKMEIENWRRKERDWQDQLVQEKDKNADLLRKIASFSTELQATQAKLEEASSLANKFKGEAERLLLEVNMAKEDNNKSKSDLQSLAKEIEQLIQNNNALKNAHEQLSGKYSALENDLVEKEKEVEELQKEADSLESEQSKTLAELRRIELERLSLKPEHDKLTRKTSSLEDETAQLKKKIQALHGDHDKLAIELAAKEKDIENEQDTNGQLREEIEALKTKVQFLDQQDKERVSSDNVFLNSLSSFRNVNVESSQTNSKTTAGDNEHNMVIHTLEQQLADGLEQLKDSKDLIAKQEKKLKDNQTAIVELTRENADLKAKLEIIALDAKNQEGVLAQRNRQLTAAHDNSQNLAVQLRERTLGLAQLGRDAAALKEENEDLKNRLANAEALSEKYSRNTAIQSTVKNTAVSSTTISFDIKEQLANLAKLGSELNDARFENDALKKKLRKADEEQDQLSRQVAQLTQNIESLNLAVKDKSAALKSAGSENTVLKSENETLKIRLRSVGDDTSQHEKMMGSLASEIEGLQNELRSKNSAIADLNKSLSRAQKEVDNAFNKTSTSFNKMDELNKRTTQFDLAEESEQLREKNTENEALKSVVSELRRELESLRRKLGSTDDELRHKEKRTKAAETKMEHLSKELKLRDENEAKLGSESLQLKTALDLLQFKLAAVQNELDSKNALLQNQNAMGLSAMDANLARDRQASALTLNELGAARTENENLKRKIRNFEGDFADKENQVEQLSEKIKTLVAENASLKKGHADSQELDRLQRKVTELENDLARERKNFADNARTAASFEVKINANLAEIENFKGNKSYLENELQNKSREIVKLKADSQKLEQQLLSMQYAR